MHTLASSHLKFPRPRMGKVLSVMAWIEDGTGNILLVRQTKDKRLWTLPGGKVRVHEALSSALERELAEEIGQSVLFSRVVDIFDRPEKDAVCFLFRTVLKGARLKLGKEEIEASMITVKLPENATPSLNYFWKHRFGDKNPVCPAESSTRAEKVSLIAA